jgi:1-phosphofructokinase family hexose kinase
MDSVVPSVGLEYDIVIAAPNPAVDSYYLLPEFKPGEVNRAVEVLHTAGGKGYNMARAAHMLGGRVLTVGPVGGSSGDLIMHQLALEGIASAYIATSSETRRCSTVLTTIGSQSTVVLEPGAPLSDNETAALHQLILQQAHKAPYLVLTGSLPPDLSPAYYADLIVALRGTHVQICVDTSGEALRLAGDAGAAVIKVNVEEFCSAFAPQGWSLASAHATFQRLRTNGLQILAITSGADGAYVFGPENSPLHVRTPTVDWITTAGSGDSFLAGLLISLAQGATLTAAAQRASAAAAANMFHPVCGHIEPADYERLSPQTRIRALTAEEYAA